LAVQWPTVRSLGVFVGNHRKCARSRRARRGIARIKLNGVAERLERAPVAGFVALGIKQVLTAKIGVERSHILSATAARLRLSNVPREAGRKCTINGVCDIVLKAEYVIERAFEFL